jgi:hypothetical protein
MAKKVPDGTTAIISILLPGILLAFTVASYAQRTSD